MPISKGQPLGGATTPAGGGAPFLDPNFWKMLMSLSGAMGLPGTQKTKLATMQDPTAKTEGLELTGATPVLSDATNPGLDPFGSSWSQGMGGMGTLGQAFPAPRRIRGLRDDGAPYDPTNPVRRPGY